MPVLLHGEDEEQWLRAPLAESMELVAHYPAQLMRVDGYTATLAPVGRSMQIARAIAC